MSQHTLSISNGSGSSVRSAINSALAAVGNLQKGSGAPSGAAAGWMWLDDDTPSSTNWTLKIYDGTDWITVGTLDTTANTFTASGASAASESAAGIAEIATQSETNTGTDDTRFVTPLKLASWTGGGKPVIGDMRNLVAQWASNSTLTVTADELVLKNGSGIPYLASSVNVTANIASSGANGLDTGAEAGNTWYYVWIIYNGTTVASLLSTSSTSPTMPSGYTYKALVGAVRNDGSSNFVRFWQYDRRVSIANQEVFTTTAGVTSYTSQSLSSYVPPIARFASGSIGCSGAASGFVTAVAGDGNGVGAQYQGGTSGSVAVDGQYAAGSWTDIPLMTAQTVYWKARNTTAEYEMNVSGFLI